MQLAQPAAPELRSRIDALDLGPIKFKLVHEYGWTRNEADRTELQYKAFLYLTQAHPGKSIVPTQRIDEMWHQHILDTRKYMEDCDTLFGGYLHHFPYFGIRGADDAIALANAFSETIELFEKDCGITLTTSTSSLCDGGDSSYGDPDSGDSGSDGDSGSSSCTSSSCSDSGTTNARKSKILASADCTSGSCGTACGAQCSDYVRSEVRPVY